MVVPYVTRFFKIFDPTMIFLYFNIDSYNGPSPPAGSGPHRYLFLLYQSNDKIPERKFDTLQRLRFPLQQYVTDTQLGLLDVTYFTVDN